MLKLNVPMTPPSVGHYQGIRIITPKATGKPLPMFYDTSEAKAWWKAIAASAGGRNVEAAQYIVAFVLHLPPRSRMDLDNGAKCVLDGLTKAKVIRDDRYVIEVHAYKVKAPTDWEARTEIYIKPAGQLSLLEVSMPSIDDW